MNRDDLLERVAGLLAEEKVVGWVQGRMEFGPRALGNRSILVDPRSPRMQSVLNLKVKFRESFRPFAPAALEERAAEFFELDTRSPPTCCWWRRCGNRSAWWRPRVSDGTGSAQAVAIPHTGGDTRGFFGARPDGFVGADSMFHELLRRFETKTGCPVLVNTSFNVRGEPVVCTPDDAYRCFVNTEMDYVAIGNFLLDRAKQPARGVKQKYHSVPD